MIAEEVRATVRLGGHVATGIATRVEGVHRAVAGRVFSATGPMGRPARALHDGVAGAVYTGLRIGGLAAGTVAGEVAGRVVRPSSPAGSTRLGNQALAALNGFAGHHLKGDLSPLAIRMAIRSAGRDVGLAPVSLAAEFPDATARIAVFVHGLAETENFWTGKASGQSEYGYGQLLRTEFGYTPVYVRYNSGQHVSENGRSLGRLLSDLVAAWPVPPEEVLLVGHSMGGLVIRSACHYAGGEKRSWVTLVRHIVYLGSPHLGAPLARAAGLAGWTMSRLPETRPFAPFLNGSSDGVKDLRFGYLLDEDWSGCDPDDCRRDHRGDVPLMDSANHYVISVTISADPESPLGAIVGDLLVQPASAHGRCRRRQHIPFPVELGRSLGGLTHFDLVNHPSVWAEIRSLLQSTSGSPDPGRVGSSHKS